MRRGQVNLPSKVRSGTLNTETCCTNVVNLELNPVDLILAEQPGLVQIFNGVNEGEDWRQHLR